MDEIWSLELLRPLTSIDQIFWRVNHDNNHFLNSIYLYLVGPDASPLIQRGLSVALGVATIAVAAMTAAARGRWTMIATSLLFAVSYPMVHYGSEARGYAGLVLFTLACVLLLERRLDGRGSTLAFAAAILLGFLSHLTMLEAAVVLAVWATWMVWLRTRRLARTVVEVGWIFIPAGLAVLPLAIGVVVGAKLFGFSVGGVSPFTLPAFADGYGGMIRYLFGLPSWIGNWACIFAAWVPVGVSAVIWRDRRSGLYVIGIVGLPMLMAAARLPNLEFPRYFLVSATLLLLWAGEVLGRGLDAGGKHRLLAAGGLVAVLMGTAVSLLSFYEYGRGSYSAIVERMTRDGSATYASNHDFRTGMVVDHFAARLDRQASLVPQGKVCAERPAWLILEGPPDNQAQHVTPEANCTLAYERVAASASWGLSGLGWTLYRRVD
ncbi:hypothetical protein [Mesorhizobium sp.]|uniref:hypothetical protein n=1 Tax=Mesorhizobium sp. TaxID=1871066 RepID=UPI003BAB5665